MEHLTSDEAKTASAGTDLVRRRGDRRVRDEAVAEDRRKADRRDIPGVTALIRTLFRRETGNDS